MEEKEMAFRLTMAMIEKERLFFAPFKQGDDRHAYNAENARIIAEFYQEILDGLLDEE